MNTVLTPILTSTAGTNRSYNVGIADTYSWVPIEGEALGRPMYARAGYITNFSDLSIQLSAAELNVGAVTIKDEGTGINADVVNIPGYGAGLQVLTQDLESSIDDITIGDKGGINYATVNAYSSSLNVSINDTFNTTSKNRLKISNSVVEFYNTFQYSKELDVWDETATGAASAVHTNIYSGVELSVTNAQNDKVVRQTRNVTTYHPGKSNIATFAIQPAVVPSHSVETLAGIRTRFGLYTGEDGFYFETYNDGVEANPLNYFSLNILNNSVKTTILRPQWNIDVLDGNGPSGIILSAGKEQLVCFEYEWYGAGQITLAFVIDGKFIPVHSHRVANRLTKPWSRTPFLPFRLELENVTGGQTIESGKATFIQGSNSLQSEGTTSSRGVTYSHITDIDDQINLNTASVFYPIFSIRLKSTTLEAIVKLEHFTVSTAANTTLFYKIIRNATTLSQGTWTPFETVDSFVEYLEAPATGVLPVSGGEVLEAGIISQNSSNINYLAKDQGFSIGRTDMGATSDTITIAVATAVGNKDTIVAATWLEQR